MALTCGTSCCYNEWMEKASKQANKPLSYIATPFDTTELASTNAIIWLEEYLRIKDK